MTTTTTDPVQDVIAGGILALGVLQFVSNRRSKKNTAKLDDVHSLVNQQLTDAIDRRDVSEAENAQLKADAKDTG